MKINSASVILQVQNLSASLAFYVDVLGFTREFVYGDPPFYGGVKRDDTVIHLSASPESNRRLGLGSVYVFCDEVDTFYSEVKRKGAEITSPLNTYPYGMRDFQLKDPDGNLICFGCPVEESKEN